MVGCPQRNVVQLVGVKAVHAIGRSGAAGNCHQRRAAARLIAGLGVKPANVDLGLLADVQSGLAEQLLAQAQCQDSRARRHGVRLELDPP